MRLDLKPSKELGFISSIPVKSLLMLAIRDNKAKAKGCSPEWFETQWVRKVSSPLDTKILRIGVKVAQQTLTLSVLVRIQYPQPCVHRRHITNKYRPIYSNFLYIEENLQIA